MADILIVEDEKPINNLMTRNLTLTGHACTQAFDGDRAYDLIFIREWDLIILDIMLPGKSGYELMKNIRNTPVIFVTARDGIQDRLRGLTSGAEDYLVKPFEMQELIARVNILLRRYHRDETEFVLDGVKVSFDSRTVFRDGAEVEMTPREFDLLEVFIKNRNLALSRERILSLAWGYDYEGDTRTVDVHVQKLRRKLHWEDHIKTVFKMGYRLEIK